MNAKCPYVSLILPLKVSNESLKLLPNCLSSIDHQTYRRFELILVADKKTNLNFFLEKYTYIRVIHCSKGKTAARNVGSMLSNGKFLLHIDVDMYLSPRIIEECVHKSLISNNDALIIPETLSSDGTFFDNVRATEKKLYHNDSSVECIRFIKKSIFKEIGGFDESLDPLDEWDLHLSLISKGYSFGRISSQVLVSHSLSFIDNVRGKYQRGRRYPALRRKYPKSNQGSIRVRSKVFIQNFKDHPKNVLFFLALIFMKVCDAVPFYLGAISSSLFPQRVSKQKEINKKLFDKEATTYEAEFYKNKVGARYVDTLEKKQALDMLNKINFSKNPKILDMGVGPGRWSRFILENFKKPIVFGMDISPKMVEVSSRNLSHYGSRFVSVIGDMEHMPFEDNSFDCVFTVRAIKYSPEPDIVFSEVHRVLKPNGIFIMETANPNLVYSLLKPLKSFFSIFNFKFIAYLNRITLLSPHEINVSLLKSNFKNIDIVIKFALPSTLYIKLDSKVLVSGLSFLESILPKKLFGRSIFLFAVSNK